MSKDKNKISLVKLRNAGRSSQSYLPVYIKEEDIYLEELHSDLQHGKITLLEYINEIVKK